VDGVDKSDSPFRGVRGLEELWGVLGELGGLEESGWLEESDEVGGGVRGV